LEFAVPELHWIAFVRLDMIGNARCHDLALCQAHRAQRLVLKLIACSAMPECFVVKLTHKIRPSSP
jgi:hypothetical protein